MREGEMKSTKRNMFSRFCFRIWSTEAGMAISCLAAYLTAFTFISILYFAGFF